MYLGKIVELVDKKELFEHTRIESSYKVVHLFQPIHMDADLDQDVYIVL